MACYNWPISKVGNSYVFIVLSEIFFNQTVSSLPFVLLYSLIFTLFTSVNLIFRILIYILRHMKM
jgi:hypothetical protein